MSITSYKYVKISGIKTVIPPAYIDIDDEIEFFDNNFAKLKRTKRIIGYGRRYYLDEDITVTDIAINAAQKLISEMNLPKNAIGLLIFVNQRPDYILPPDVSIAHDKLGLNTDCTALNLNMGCSGLVHALMIGYSLLPNIDSRYALILAGDSGERFNRKDNRKLAPVFGDTASATILEVTSEQRNTIFITGTDGAGWDKIIQPFGGMRIPFDEELINLKVQDESGNVYTSFQGMMQGEEVFNFSMAAGPKLINDLLKEADWRADEVDLYAIHQANKQIVKTIVELANIPQEKAPWSVFEKYANNSTASISTVICDQPKDAKLEKVILCSFGVGYSWAGAALDLSGLYNGGIDVYVPPDADKIPSREEQINHWINIFKGE